METDIEARKGSDWPEVMRSLEATLRRLSDRVLELNERTRESDAESGAEEPAARIDAVGPGPE